MVDQMYRNIRVPFTRDLLADLITTFGYEIGEHTYGRPAIHVPSLESRLVIGKYCSIAAGVIILMGGYHPTDWVSTYPFPTIAGWEEASSIPYEQFRRGSAAHGNVMIGNDVWLGTGCMILSGVTIGDGAVIAAGAIVTHDVDPYTIVAGSPARALRKRFADMQIAMLREMRWWTWSDADVKAALSLICSPHIEALYTHWKNTSSLRGLGFAIQET